MLHEGLGSVAQWKDFPLQLAERTGAAVFVFSRWGHGNSDPLDARRPVSYMHDEAKILLPEILKKADIHMPLLLGHSDGGSIAIIYAGTFPDCVAGIILEAPHVFVEDITVESIAQAKIQYQTTKLAKKLGQYHASVDSMFWGWNDIWLDPRFRDWNIESYLDRIACPVLVIQGREDEYGTVRQIDAIRDRVPWAESILVENCRHAPHRDQTKITLEQIARFLSNL
jgi:pimeloyl-ACP methyl ester carboxylesterase